MLQKFNILKSPNGKEANKWSRMVFVIVIRDVRLHYTAYKTLTGYVRLQKKDPCIHSFILTLSTKCTIII